MISQTCIDLIKQTADVVDVIKGFVKLKAKGSDQVGLCPFHTEKTPSFHVSPSKHIYKCFGCGKSGDAISFLMDHENLNYIDAIKWLANKYNIPIEEEGGKRVYEKPIPRLEKLSGKALTYLEQERKISNHTLLRLQITEANEWMPLAKKEIQVICFNYYRDGELVNIKYRGGGKDFKMAKNAELIFYNLDAIKDEDTVIIVEGEIDCLTLHECGIYNVVSVPNGAEATRLEYLNNCWQYFEDKTKIILAVDNDQAGFALREELARRLGKDRCYRVNFPENTKDANEFYLKYGKSAITVMIDEAKPWPIEGVITMDDMFGDIQNYYNHGYPEGCAAKIDGFDDHLSFMLGQMTVVTGIPGSGKSEFIDYLMTKLSTHHHWQWGVCSFENQPSAIHATKLMEKFSGKAFTFRKNPYDRMTSQEFEEAIFNVDQYFNFININQIDVTLTGILQKAKELVKRKGVKGLVIDPWNYIEHKVPEGYTETQYISEALTEIKTFAIHNGVHVFLVAHPTKMMKDKATKKYEIPNLYSISGSAHFFNKADNGICVHRDFSSSLVDVYIQKVRYSWLGKIGFTSFEYNTMTRQYNPLN
jgi:twinkle protein